MPRFVCFIVAALLAVAAQAIEATPRTRNTPPVPLLWKACDSDNCLYLLGSFHALKASDYPLRMEVDEALRESEEMLFEVAPAEMADKTRVGLAMGQAGIRSDGSLLDSELSPAQRTKLANWVQSHQKSLASQGLSEGVLQRLKPWYVALLISVMQLQDAGMQSDLGLDDHLGVRGAKLHRAMAGLETVDEQVTMLADMDSVEQRQFLEEALNESNAGDGQLQALHAVWRSGDAARLWQLGGVEMQRDYPRLYQRLIVARNQRWLPKLQAKLQGGHANDDVLVTVGALHLLGSDGVVEGLRRRGYNVQRVCAGCSPTLGH